MNRDQQSGMIPPAPPMMPRPTFAKSEFVFFLRIDSMEYLDDEETGQVGGEWGNFSGLENKEIRRVFVRKVYSILLIQLLVTFGIIALFHFT